MSGRSMICVLLSVFMLVAIAWAADEQIVYNGDFVSLGSTTRICASALEGDNGSLVGSPNVGLWLQAWDMSGNTRFIGPGGTIYTNSLGKACSLKTLLTGLYTVQAFGATGAFDGLASMPAVIASLTPNSCSVASATAGIASVQSPNGPREVAVGDLLQAPRQALTVAALPGGRSLAQLQNLRPNLVQFLLLDPDNPAGPTRIWSGLSQFQMFVFMSSPPQANSYSEYRGFCDVQIGGLTYRGIMKALLRINNGWFRYNAVPITTLLTDGGGTLEIHVTTLSGKPVYDAAGSFRGSTGMYFAPFF
ncbi:MAG: hypothetical protein KBC96_01940 [Armatimonadetes bacterium]|nr:hypothetical protein [Armatimonadota bacterium]